MDRIIIENEETTIVTDDNQELTLEEVCQLLRVCRAYVESIKENYPYAHDETMEGFREAGEDHPDIREAEKLFESTMHA